jgi:hypothetical protein
MWWLLLLLLVLLQGPCVLFATPGMLHGGTSLEVFKAWAPSDRNLVLLPSYQAGPAHDVLDVLMDVWQPQPATSAPGWQPQTPSSLQCPVPCLVHCSAIAD